jgi:excisionase family DNA binding protein
MDERAQDNGLADLTNRTVITVEEAARALRIGRSAAYEAVRRGQLPALRIGRRVLVPVPRLLALLGNDDVSLTAAPAEDS